MGNAPVNGNYVGPPPPPQLTQGILSDIQSLLYSQIDPCQNPGDDPSPSQFLHFDRCIIVTVFQNVTVTTCITYRNSGLNTASGEWLLNKYTII